MLIHVAFVVKLDKKSCFLVLEEELLAPDLGRETTETLFDTKKCEADLHPKVGKHKYKSAATCGNTECCHGALL